MTKTNEKYAEKAHDIQERPRTEDVIVEDNIDFDDLLLSESTLKGLRASGFMKPSPIQRKAIPLGKCGFDLITQAKSGTGKTCVFAVVALEMVEVELEKLQVLILSPTREISVQIRDVISSIGRFSSKLKVEAFIGGLSLENDKKKLKKCQIAVGAPGRVKHLIAERSMNLDAVRLFVLDEADKLMEDSFREDISAIYLKLPAVKQMIAASATFPQQLEDFVTRFMTNPMRVSPGGDTFLIGIRQFVSVIPSHLSVFVQMKNKLAELKRILSMISFKQCLVFSNYQSRAESICNELNKEGWPAIYINGSQNQTARLEAMSSLKEFKCRVFLSTDLSSRGIDAENVNLIINLDLPYDGATYMHRIGRAGRYGTFGLAITIVQSGAELEQFHRMLKEMGCTDFQVSLFPEGKLECDIWDAKDEDFKKISDISRQLQSLTVAESSADTKKPERRDEEEEEIRRMAASRLSACHFSFPNKPKIIDYDDLLNDALKFKEPADSKVNGSKNKVEIKDFSPELKSSAIYIEEKDWEKHTQKLQQFSAALERKKSRKMNKSKREKNYTNNKSKEVNEKESDDDDEDENEDEVNEADNSDEVSGSNGEEPNWAEEGIESPAADNSHLNQWYSMWYSQLHTVRYYTNFLRYFYYLNEMTN